MNDRPGITNRAVVHLGLKVDQAFVVIGSACAAIFGHLFFTFVETHPSRPKHHKQRLWLRLRVSCKIHDAFLTAFLSSRWRPREAFAWSERASKSSRLASTSGTVCKTPAKAMQ